MYVKFLNEEEVHYGLNYKYGLNADPLPWNPTGECEPGGLYFSDAETCLEHLNPGEHFWVREVEVPDDAEVYEEPDHLSYKASSLIVGPRRALSCSDTWRWLKENGAKLNFFAVVCAICRQSEDALEYLLDERVVRTPSEVEGAKCLSRYSWIQVHKRNTFLKMLEEYSEKNKEYLNSPMYDGRRRSDGNQGIHGSQQPSKTGADTGESMASDDTVGAKKRGRVHIKWR